MRYIPSALFFLFIGWITFEANLDQYNTFIRWGREIPNGDKIGHFLIYGIMAFLLNFSLRFNKVSARGIKLYVGSLLVLAYAIAEEFTQLAFESRTFDYADMFSDFFGIICFSLLSVVFEVIFRNKYFAAGKG